MPAFVRPKPEKMVRKELVEEILASSPELKQVEVDREVNILGEDAAVLSQ